jgi:hypothetical protein
MRIGSNPSNHERVETNTALHRVIIPVYIPDENDYFKDAFHIFEYCLLSLLKTSSTNLKISIVSNGSCCAVNKKLFEIQQKLGIDELIIEKEGIGKVNSVLKVLRTVEERLITITDADVLFVNGWEEAVLDVFKAFPNAGAVCPTPVYRKHFQLTSNIWMRYLFSSNLRFLPVKNPEAMTKFANSIGWPWLDEKYKDVIATLSSEDEIIAMVGCSHFVATYKKEVFTEIPKGNSQFKIRGNSEYLYTDLPVLKKGGYRLSTYDNYAYHMGNKLETWMTAKFENLLNNEKDNEILVFKTLKKPSFDAVLLEKLFKFLISFPFINRRILTRKGLTKQQVKNFKA